MQWAALQLGINRNIVECKVACSRCLLSLAFVLIETLWNVKQTKEMERYYAQCINRNIVECKDKFKIMSDDGGIQVLIETLWNVKSYRLYS